jgi:predicted dehydrogenase
MGGLRGVCRGLKPLVSIYRSIAMTHHLRLGLVGTSWWAELAFLPALATHPRARVAAICGRNQQRANDVAARFGVPQVYADYREMIASGQLDAVIVAAPDDLHYPITIAALDAGLHVLCEKPLALNAEHARAMYERAEAAGRIHMVNFTWRLVPHLQQMRQLVADGYIGRCVRSEFRFLGSYGWDSTYQWRFDKRRANGILGDLGSHVIDLAHWLVGDITAVNARLETFVERVDDDDRPVPAANDVAVLLVTFENGALGLIEASAVDHASEIQIVLQGTAGRLEAGVPVGAGELYLRGRRGGDEMLVPLDVPEALWHGIVRGASDFESLIALAHHGPVGVRHFVDSILAGRKPSANFRDGMRAQHVVDAAMQAHSEGAWVTDYWRRR